MDPQTIADETSRPNVRCGLSVTLAVVMIVTVILNALAGAGVDPFKYNTGNVSDTYYTCFTPAGYTFAIWSVIYICLVFTVIYALTIPCRKTPDDKINKTLAEIGGAVPNTFLLMFILSCLINISWLFAWDNLQMIAAAILLLLIAITNIIASLTSLRRFSQTGNTLFQLYKVDFVLNIIVINGYALYTTWTFLAANLNLAIMFIHEADLPAEGVCTGHLAFILVAMLIFAIVEAAIAIKLLNVLFSHYFVYLWASVGIYMKNAETSTSTNYGLIIANITLAAILCLQRIIVVIVRNWKNPFYKHGIDIQSISLGKNSGVTSSDRLKQKTK